MLSVVFGLPLVFALLIWRSYRSAAARSARGESLGTPGALRWSAASGESGAGARRGP